MTVLRRAWRALVSVEPASKQPVFWPFWLIIGSSFGIFSGVAAIRWTATFAFVAGCVLTLRYISFNGLGFQDFKRK